MYNQSSMKKFILAIIILILIGLSTALLLSKGKATKNINELKQLSKDTVENPLSISQMRTKSYPGSDIQIETNLEPTGAYDQFVTSYQSEGFKINALLTVPKGQKPSSGWPVVIFNHGYIPPEQYQTTERYVAYVDAFARNGYIVFKPDYRGNGQSEGQPQGAYYSPAYATDVLNALSSVKNYKDADGAKIGMWGHSMGGNITLRSLEVSPDIKAAVIWGGVVGSYDDLINHWRRRTPFASSSRELVFRNQYRESLLKQFGQPSVNPDFWNKIDPFYNVSQIIAPVQLHAGTSDEEVPVEFSQKLKDQLEKNGKSVEFYTYEGANHNISSPAFELAMKRSVAFFDKYLKN